MVTGGIPGITATAEDVYRRTWPRVLEENAEHFRRFPLTATYSTGLVMPRSPARSASQAATC